MPPWVLVEGSPALDEPKSRDSGSIGIEAYHLVHNKRAIPRGKKNIETPYPLYVLVLSNRIKSQLRPPGFNLRLKLWGVRRPEIHTPKDSVSIVFHS